MYVDESGDAGLTGSPSRYFVLTGLVVHELRWQTYLDQLQNFRRRMKTQYGLLIREEIHSAKMITKPGDLARIPKHHRLSIIREYADELANMSDLNIINIVVDKQRPRQAGYDVFGMAWKTLIQRFENTISRRNFPGPQNADERGMLFPDHTDDKKLTQLLRSMRVYNPISHQQQFGQGYRNIKLQSIVEDPNFRDSAHSLYIQSADLAAFLLYQHLAPNSYMRQKSGQNYFERLQPILCTKASSSNPRGIVHL